jgi:anthranilate phosphoribosyltransferase
VPGLGQTLARVLDLMGSVHALIVHGEDGLDEISVSAPTQVHEARDGQVVSYTIEPEQFGIPRSSPDAVRGGTVDVNVRMAHAVLGGERGPSRDVVLLNAGASIYMAGLAESIQDGIARVADELDSGRARAKVAQVASASQQIKADQAAMEAA